MSDNNSTYRLVGRYVVSLGFVGINFKESIRDISSTVMPTGPTLHDYLYNAVLNYMLSSTLATREESIRYFNTEACKRIRDELQTIIPEDIELLITNSKYVYPMLLELIYKHVNVRSEDQVILEQDSHDYIVVSHYRSIF